MAWTGKLILKKINYYLGRKKPVKYSKELLKDGGVLTSKSIQ